MRCKDKSPDEIACILEIAKNKTVVAQLHEDSDYWFFRCKELEIEWVLTCVKAYTCIRDGKLPHGTLGRAWQKTCDVLGIGVPS